MSDALEITSGGAIAIDSSMVRDIGHRLGQVAHEAQGAAELVQTASATCAQAPTLAIGTGGMIGCMQRLGALADATRTHAHRVELMADTFELVELRNRQAALEVHRPEAALALQARIDELISGDPDIENKATMLVAGWQEQRFDGTGDQPLDDMLATIFPSTELSPLGPGALAIAFMAVSQLAAKSGQGLLPYGTKLQGPPPPVRVDPVTKGTTTPVSGVRDSLSRIPKDRPGQVVVEKYTMKDGSERFVAYIDGTRAVSSGYSDPWDMGSNWDLYVDRDQAASQVAVDKALEAAGASPGDRVDLVGYSQGAAIASFTAMEGVYDVGVVVTAGNPTEASLASDQTLVDLRHRGDIFSNLAGGGSAGGTGSPESFTAVAEVDAMSPVGAHRLEEYIDTAGQIDASGDPRVRQLQETFFAELGDAERVETTEFKATRP
ncbi:hypothetical protein WDU99_12840 [Microbacterium sp. Mu-80]|uniref:Alpha/beta hydrolase n=1 Tax=Microbacterium bandirmense TaxID=3122050 RepID=A0ABU8LF39_9MICO